MQYLSRAEDKSRLMKKVQWQRKLKDDESWLMKKIIDKEGWLTKKVNNKEIWLINNID